MKNTKKLTITFLLDSPDNWMIQHASALINKLKPIHSVRLIHSAEEIQEGDILFILSFYKLVPENFLNLNKHNIVIHASKLPQGKGWSPATWQILAGENKIPLTLFEAINKVDAGPIYFQDELELDGTELIENWQNKMGQKIIEMAERFLKKYPDVKGIEQIGADSYYSKRTPKDSELNINKTISNQFNLFRVVDNEKYPAFFKHKGKKYILRILEDPV